MLVTCAKCFKRISHLIFIRCPYFWVWLGQGPCLHHLCIFAVPGTLMMLRELLSNDRTGHRVFTDKLRRSWSSKTKSKWESAVRYLRQMLMQLILNTIINVKKSVFFVVVNIRTLQKNRMYQRNRAKGGSFKNSNWRLDWWIYQILCGKLSF